MYGAWDIVDDLDHRLEHRPAKRSEVAKLIDPPAGILPARRSASRPCLSGLTLRIAGGIDERLHMCMDYDLMVRLSRLGPPTLVPETQALFRVSGESKNLSHAAAMWAESCGNRPLRRCTTGPSRIVAPVLLRHPAWRVHPGHSARPACRRVEDGSTRTRPARSTPGAWLCTVGTGGVYCGDLRGTLGYGFAATRSKAPGGPELAIVGRGVLITAIMLDRDDGAPAGDGRVPE